MSSWTSYPKIYNVGHRKLTGFFDGPVRVEEKVDGSQFSFGLHGGELKVRSRGREFDPHGPDNLFTEAARVALELKPHLIEGWTYRGEYLKSKRHNGLEYERIPNNHIALFDIAIGADNYAAREVVDEEAERLGLDAAPVLYEGTVGSPEDVQQLMDSKPLLGGFMVEGLVFKRVNQDKHCDQTGKPLIAKYVSERFREIQGKQWNKDHPHKQKQGAIIDELVSKYGTEQRWHKAAQHLRESGQLDGSPKDIGPLMREVQTDMEAECIEAIKDDLYQVYRKELLRRCARGVPEWYKSKLLEGQWV